MPQLVRLLPNHLSGGHHIPLDREVIDKTGLTGKFDFTVEWNPDPVSGEIRAPSKTAPRLLPIRFFAFPVESNAPNFVAALEAQLGLMLDTQWVPQPVLVVDRIEPPDEN